MCQLAVAEAKAGVYDPNPNFLFAAQSNGWYLVAEAEVLLHGPSFTHYGLHCPFVSRENYNEGVDNLNKTNKEKGVDYTYLKWAATRNRMRKVQDGLGIPRYEAVDVPIYNPYGLLASSSVQIFKSNLCQVALYLLSLPEYNESGTLCIDPDKRSPGYDPARPYGHAWDGAFVKRACRNAVKYVETCTRYQMFAARATALGKVPMVLPLAISLHLDGVQADGLGNVTLNPVLVAVLNQSEEARCNVDSVFPLSYVSRAAYSSVGKSTGGPSQAAAEAAKGAFQKVLRVGVFSEFMRAAAALELGASELPTIVNASDLPGAGPEYANVVFWVHPVPVRLTGDTPAVNEVLCLRNNRCRYCNCPADELHRVGVTHSCRELHVVEEFVALAKHCRPGKGAKGSTTAAANALAADLGVRALNPAWAVLCALPAALRGMAAHPKGIYAATVTAFMHLWQLGLGRYLLDFVVEMLGKAGSGTDTLLAWFNERMAAIPAYTDGSRNYRAFPDGVSTISQFTASAIHDIIVAMVVALGVWLPFTMESGKTFWICNMLLPAPTHKLVWGSVLRYLRFMALRREARGSVQWALDVQRAAQKFVLHLHAAFDGYSKSNWNFIKNHLVNHITSEIHNFGTGRGSSDEVRWALN